jgi:hypothetical protein
VSRVITLCVIVVGASIGVHELNHLPRPQPIFPPPTNAVPIQTPGPINGSGSPAAGQFSPKGGKKKAGKKMSARPSFDCAKAQASVELLSAGTAGWRLSMSIWLPPTKGLLTACRRTVGRRGTIPPRLVQELQSDVYPSSERSRSRNLCGQFPICSYGRVERSAIRPAHFGGN